MTRAWFPPTISRTPFDHRLWNAFLSHAESPVKLEGGATASFTRTIPPAGRSPCLAVDIPGGPRVALVFRAFPFQAMYDAELTVEDLAVLPEELAGALYEGMGSVVTDLLPERWAGTCSVLPNVAAIGDDTELADWEWFTVAIDGLASQPIVFDAGCDRSKLLVWLRTREPAARRIWQGLRKRLTATANFTIGSFLRRADELLALKVGSLAVMPAAEPGIHTVRIDETLYDFLKEEDGFVCLGSRPWGSGDDLVPPEVPATTEQSEREHMQIKKGPGSLQVILDFDLGRISVPLAEIETWQIGSIVPMRPPARTGGMEVTIRANGSVIGSGDLVQIDDRLAVRITRLEF